jgi:ABC-type transport system involved in multi-copper enzyme maturation permease subunit
VTDHVATLVIAGFAALLILAHSVLDLRTQLLAWLLLAGLVAVLHRRGWIKLVGPILFYDLIMQTRKTRHFLIRALFSITLVVLFLSLYGGIVQGPGGLRNRDLAAATEAFFFFLMAALFVVTLVVTPAYVGDAIADEKERGTLELILTTDLRSSEIVLAKLVSRLANLLLFLATALPILSFLQFFGGIDPELLLLSFVLLGLTVFSLAALSLFASVLCDRSRTAILLTYVIAVVYCSVGWVAQFLCSIPLATLNPSWLGTVGSLGISLPSWMSDDPLTLGTLAEGFNAGNIVAIPSLLLDGLSKGQSLAELLPDIVRWYGGFHATVGLTLVLLSVARLRPVALRGKDRLVRGKPARAWRGRNRPVIGVYPVFWREVHANRSRIGTWGTRLLIVGMMVLGLYPPVAIFCVIFFGHLPGASGSIPWDRLAWEVNTIYRMFLGLIGALLWVGVAIRSAGAITGEREKNTLDELLTSGLSSREIIFGKWLGALLSFRQAWGFMGLMMVPALFFHSISPLAIPLQMAVWVIHAGFFAMVGVYASVRFRRTLTATLMTLTLTLVFGSGILYQIINWPYYQFLMPHGGPSFNVLAFTPVFNLPFSDFSSITWPFGRDIYGVSEPMPLMIGSMFLGYAWPLLATWALADLAIKGFDRRFMRKSDGVAVPLPDSRGDLIPNKSTWGWKGLARVGIAIVMSITLLRMARYFWSRETWVVQDEVLLSGSLVGAFTWLIIATKASLSLSPASTSTTDVKRAWGKQLPHSWWGLAWLLVLMTIGVSVGVVPTVALLYAAILWLVYSSLFVAIGLYFSVRCRSRLWAVGFTLATVFVVCGGHWLVNLMVVFSIGFVLFEPLKPLLLVQVALTPPLPLSLSSLPLEKYQESDWQFGWLVMWTLIGLVVAVLTTAFLVVSADRRLAARQGSTHKDQANNVSVVAVEN